MDTRISFVIITRNRCATLLSTLHRLTSQFPAIPVIVVDNASTDETVPSVRQQFPAVQILPLQQNIGSAARNCGVRAASTPYVAFCDDDSWWRPDAIPRAIACFEAHPAVALIAGTILVNAEERVDPVSVLQATSPLPCLVPMPGPAILGFLGCGVFVRTSAYLEVGGYNRRMGVGGEEQLLAIDLAAAGWGLTYVADLVGYHHPSPARHPARRQAGETRNRIWTAWLRRPWRTAVRLTWVEVRKGLRNRHVARGVAQAIPGARYVLRHRHLPPPQIEAQLLMLEHQPPPRGSDLERNAGA